MRCKYCGGCEYYGETSPERGSLVWCSHKDNKNQYEGNCQDEDCPLGDYNEVCDDCWECECQKCEACVDLMEIAYENFVEDFYGSSEPFTLNEKLEQAKKEGK